MAGQNQTTNSPFYFEEGEAISFREAFSNEKKKAKSEDTLDPFRKYLVQEYLKVGLFCGMTPDQYMDSKDPWFLEAISKELDERLAPYLAKYAKKVSEYAESGESQLPINYTHLALLLTMASIFGDK